MAEDLLPPGKVSNVMHDQEVSGQIELFDDPEFMFQLSEDRSGQGGSVAVPCALQGQGLQVSILAFADRHGKPWEMIFEILQSEGTAFRHGPGGQDPFGVIAKAFDDGFRLVEMAFSVDQQTAACFIQCGLFMKACQGIQKSAALGVRAADIATGQNRDSPTFGHVTGPGGRSLSRSVQVA